jgi:hypothetical protein
MPSEQFQIAAVYEQEQMAVRYGLRIWDLSLKIPQPVMRIFLRLASTFHMGHVHHLPDHPNKSPVLPIDTTIPIFPSSDAFS